LRNLAISSTDDISAGQPLKDKKIGKQSMHQAIQTYYKMVGWDPERAVPTREKLQELDLGWVVEELDRAVIKK
jgi:aldehyde:ferredoxin oxidoreductase